MNSDLKSAGEAKETGGARNIVRHEHDPQKGLGWEVVINRRRQYYREFFADSHHGGNAGALAAAQIFRDALLARLPPPLPVKTRNTRNTSGVVGICITAKLRKDRHESYVIATWPGGRASFSAEKLGFDEAWRLALAARREGLASLGIHEPLPELAPKRLAAPDSSPAKRKRSR